MPTEALIRARGLTKQYRNLVALDHVDLDLAPGECLALLGVNGAGKTTLCEILEGLTLPDSGTLSILGKTYAQDRTYILERIGVQLQETHLYRKFTVRETLDLFASFYKTSEPRAELLKKLSLNELESRRLEHLSGGQRQAVYLACALINRPELVFLDEPTSGLDPHARARTWSLIKDIKHRDRGILLTTHYLEEAEALADRLAFIDKGRIVAQGTAESLIREHCPGEVWGFAIDERQWPKAKEQLLRTFPWLQSAKPENCGFSLMAHDSQQASISALLQNLNQHGYALTSLYMRRSSLEDVYFKITGKALPS
jgi:ABC-2 type transport system ATP-binding protein